MLKFNVEFLVACANRPLTYKVCHENSKIQTPHSDKCKTSQRLFEECNRTLDDVLKMRPGKLEANIITFVYVVYEFMVTILF